MGRLSTSLIKHTPVILNCGYGIYTSIQTQRNKGNENLLSVTSIHFSKD